MQPRSSLILLNSCQNSDRDALLNHHFNRDRDRAFLARLEAGFLSLSQSLDSRPSERDYSGSFSPSTAYCFSSSSDTYSNADTWVAESTTGGATPSSRASFHRDAHKHQQSPGFSPGKLNMGTGVLRSFPRALVYCKNSALTRAQTT